MPSRTARLSASGPFVVLATTTTALLLLAAATAPSAAGAATAATAAKGKHGGGGSKAKCPSDSCGLATEADVSAAVEALLAYQKPTAGIIWTTYNPELKTCKTEIHYAMDPDRPLTGYCQLFPDDVVPSVASTTTCPDGYRIAVAEACIVQLIREADDMPISWNWPVLSGGSYGNWVECNVPTEMVPIPKGTVLRIEQWVECLLDRHALDPDGPWPQKNNALATPGGQRVLAALRAAAAEDFEDDELPLPNSVRARLGRRRRAL